MVTCSSCGVSNRAGARFCYHCAAPLAPRPSPDDHAWLAATLATGSASPSLAGDDAQPRAMPNQTPAPERHAVEDEGAVMDQPQQSDAGQAAPTFAGRYEVVARHGNDVEVLDRQPWKRCWACGATS